MIVGTHSKERGGRNRRLLPPGHREAPLVSAESSVHCAWHGPLAMINENGQRA